MKRLKLNKTQWRLFLVYVLAAGMFFGLTLIAIQPVSWSGSFAATMVVAGFFMALELGGYFYHGRFRIAPGLGEFFFGMSVLIPLLIPMMFMAYIGGEGPDQEITWWEAFLTLPMIAVNLTVLYGLCKLTYVPAPDDMTTAEFKELMGRLKKELAEKKSASENSDYRADSNGSDKG